ncbi:Hpt domain-containing protein [Thermomonas flagellata]|uniref:Hpt domain-containing protein n=1 Tax=Thermomonas flagellata TaxID=2888524 RepID=UPI001F040992|nr:Hpt domain-containing protein [Thermomonas flagellata]
MNTAVQDAIDLAALGWVKPEIDETLRQARLEIEAWLEAPQDAAPMQAAAAHLHQVQGTLRMLELQAPAMVAEEMEQLARALAAGAAADREEACSVLLRGIVQLPDYLERLQGGHRDIPIVLLPLLNELRAARGQPALGREALPALLVEPTADELEHARGSLAGRNRALLDTVAAALKEDLLRVKDVLDLHLRAGLSNPTDLQPQAQALERIAETLGMLGLDGVRSLLLAQRDVLAEAADGRRPAREQDLLAVAEVLLQVDHSLDDQVARLGQAEAGDADPLAQESRRVMASVAREAIANFTEVRNAFVAFVETGWSHDALAQVPRLLGEVAGALRILQRPEPAGYLDALRRHVEVELLGARRVPAAARLDDLADALAGMEYYLEALPQTVGQRQDMLEKARASLERLAAWPIPQAAAPRAEEPPQAAARDAAAEAAMAESEEFAAEAVGEAASATTPEPEAAIAADAEPEAEDSAPAPAPAAVVAAVPAAPGAHAGFDTAGEEIDDEIREIFLDEFQEEIANLDALLPAWRRAPEDLEQLRPIRRVFHTLKGSGRLVGAKVLGEFAWHVENMLNRVLDGSRPASPAVVAFVGQAREALPHLHAALRGEALLGLDLQVMEAVADRLAAGEEVVLEAVPAAAPASAAAPLEAEPEPAPAEAPEVLAVHVDPVLLEILGTEVGGHLDTIEAWLAQARGGDAHVDEPVVRALHTLNGAFAMTEVPTVTAFTAPAEGYAKRLRAAARPMDAAGLDAMEALVAAIRASTHALQHTPEAVPVYAALAATLVALRDAQPEATVPFAPPLAEVAADLAGAGDEVDRMIAEEAACLEAERLEAERLAAEEAARLEAERLAAEEAARLEAERLAAEEAARLEAERLAAEEAARLEAERLAAEEAARLEAERLAAEEAARQEAERQAAEEAARLEAERLAAEEAARLEAERQAAEEAARQEAERLAAEEAARLEAERLAAEQAAAEEAARREAERLAAEEAARLEAERQAAEQAAREAALLEAERRAAEEAEAARVAAEQAERLAAEETARLEAERLAAEEAARQEAERLAAEEAARQEAERQAAEEAARLEAERLAAEQAAAEEAARREAERLEAERIAAARAQAERLEAERRAAERAEAERREAQRRAEEAAALAKARELAAAAMLQALPAAAEDPDAPLDMEGLDADLVDIFVEEGGDLLDHADGLLAQLRENREDREAVVGLQRDLHTLKGGARMAGLLAIGELGHAMESLLEAVAAQRVELGADGVPLLERGFDRLHAMVTRTAARRAIGLPQALIDQFNARALGAAEPVQAPPAAAAVADVPAPRRPELKPLSAPIAAAPGIDDDDLAMRAPQEQVRIRADLLDKLVNYAGEVAIYRARLEQQLAAFRSTAQEMERTNIRLRDQLRRLDAETEAQIIARYQRESEAGNEVFDPLELDRFSTLQQLSRALAESAADLQSLHGSMEDLTRQYETLLLQQSRVSSELQEGLMRTRMLPFDSLVPRLRRVVRQAAAETGKQAQLRLEGAQGELDRNVLERMTAPLEHMLRNAIAHGLESPQARAAAGKPAEGSIRIAIRREGSEVVLQVGDDGAGLDRAAIRRRAVERGLIAADAQLSDADLDVLILEPGFSTADSVSRLAGRGVGMDVVASEVRQLGGSIDIASTPGQGTTFTLRLPQTLAVTQAVFVKIGETRYAVPIASVRGVGRIAREELARADASYRYGGEDYALHDLGALVGAAPAKAEGQLQMPLLLVRSGDLRAAVAVDAVLGNREIVVKPGGPQLASVPGIFGATIMGDGSVVVILDVAPLVRRHAALPRAAAPAPVAQETRRVPLVMVVDDSVTMRKVTGRVLERHGFEVVTAKDGLDALERMADVIPDLMLLDIEMPRMDGYELATAMKGDPRMRQVPIIMITSRTGEKHRERAMQIGVERYLGKPYQEPELMRNVFELLKLERSGDGGPQ